MAIPVIIDRLSKEGNLTPTWFSSPFIQSERLVAKLPVKPSRSLVLTSICSGPGVLLHRYLPFIVLRTSYDALHLTSNRYI